MASITNGHNTFYYRILTGKLRKYIANILTKGKIVVRLKVSLSQQREVLFK